MTRQIAFNKKVGIRVLLSFTFLFILIFLISNSSWADTPYGCGTCTVIFENHTRHTGIKKTGEEYPPTIPAYKSVTTQKYINYEPESMDDCANYKKNYSLVYDFMDKGSVVSSCQLNFSLVCLYSSYSPETKPNYYIGYTFDPSQINCSNPSKVFADTLTGGAYSINGNTSGGAIAGTGTGKTIYTSLYFRFRKQP